MSRAAGRPPVLNLLHVDLAVVAVDKPPNVLSAPGRGDYPSVPDLLRPRRELADNPALRIVHRLDVEASGVLLYARTRAAQQHIVRQFFQRQVEKTYLALVSGYVAQDGEVDLPLAFDRRRNRVRANPRRGKPSLTRYRIAQRLAGNTLLVCQPVTGRLHQIRAHLAAIGHPLTVDPLYGGGEAVFLSHYKPDYRPSARRPERPLIQRLTLHAASVSLTHPVDGSQLKIEAPVPKDFRAAVNQLGRLL